MLVTNIFKITVVLIDGQLYYYIDTTQRDGPY